jgi:hypothetical protein
MPGETSMPNSRTGRAWGTVAEGQGRQTRTLMSESQKEGW